ncbi:unnamed protein product [Lactuca saligna]|uniref:Uncharacterized protein n=1 Tax=Lactuca saligna TaxID=75948 RepID=A0AA35YVY3_LACSI|nr:unnamed protein product [Lactuca saligna]
MSNDHPKLEYDNEQPETDNDDYLGFLDMEFMVDTDISTIPLSVVYPDASSEREIPQGTHNNIECDDDQLNPRKIRDSFLWGANDVEARSSSIVGSSSSLLSSKKRKLTVGLEVLAEN